MLQQSGFRTVSCTNFNQAHSANRIDRELEWSNRPQPGDAHYLRTFTSTTLPDAADGAHDIA